MTSKNDYVVAIDLGTTKIVALVGKLESNGRLKIVAHSKTVSTGVKRGMVQNIDETVKAIEAVVADVKRKAEIDFSEVYVGIAGQHIKGIKNRGLINLETYDSEVSKEDVRRLIDDMYKIPLEPGDKILHVLPQNFIVDNEVGIKNPVGISGRRLEGNFHIVVGQIAAMKNIEKCIERAGLTVNELMLEPLASARAVLTEDEMEAGVALVDIGGGTTDLAIFHEGIVRHTAVIPFGGNVVTDDIKKGCSILQRQAEQLKVQFGSAIGDTAPSDKIVTIPGISGREPKEIKFSTLAHIIQCRMEEIIDHLAYQIANSGYGDMLNAGIVITGGGSQLKDLSQLFTLHTGYDVRIGKPDINTVANSDNEMNSPMHATGIGLLLLGFEDMIKRSEDQKAKAAALKPAPQVVESDLLQPTLEEHSSEPVKPMKTKSMFFQKIKQNIGDLFSDDDISFDQKP
jgi:cell division protein FtsA